MRANTAGHWMKTVVFRGSLHIGNLDEEEVVITVTGVPEAGMAGMNVLLVGW
ncbi:MAG: hypothetical protein R3F26_01405 [Gammaproteobacteria bacterium]